MSETNTTADLSEDDKKSIAILITAYEKNDLVQLDSMIGALATSRKDEITTTLDAKAQILQQNIKNFLSGNNFLAITEEEIPDAMDRLKHVIKMTDEAAHSTIDSTEIMRDQLDEIRMTLRTAKLNENGEHDEFINELSSTVKKVGSSLNDILLAQSYQDLSGQMIKKVLMLIEDVQDNIIELIIMIGDIKPNIDASRRPAIDRLPLGGPAIPGEFNVIGNQGDVDDLFDSLS